MKDDDQECIGGEIGGPSSAGKTTVVLPAEEGPRDQNILVIKTLLCYDKFNNVTS